MKRHSMIRELSTIARGLAVAAGALICVSAGALAGCAEGSDGAETRAACEDYYAAANACWDEAGDPLDLVNECPNINVDVESTALPSSSSCGVNSLADIYTCYADVYDTKLEAGGCDTPAKASEVKDDLDRCDFSCPL